MEANPLGVLVLVLLLPFVFSWAMTYLIMPPTQEEKDLLVLSASPWTARIYDGRLLYPMTIALDLQFVEEDDRTSPIADLTEKWVIEVRLQSVAINSGNRQFPAVVAHPDGPLLQAETTKVKVGMFLFTSWIPPPAFVRRVPSYPTLFLSKKNLYH